VEARLSRAVDPVVAELLRLVGELAALEGVQVVLAELASSEGG